MIDVSESLTRTLQALAHGISVSDSDHAQKPPAFASAKAFASRHPLKRVVFDGWCWDSYNDIAGPDNPFMEDLGIKPAHAPQG